MKVFISWSGTRSHYVAKALHEWLPKVLQAVKPWMSSEDIASGTRWSDKIAQELESNHIGIICLTPENQDKPWVMFESGALSKTLGMAYVCPYLIELDPSDIKPPLNLFQSNQADKNSTLKLLKTLNERLSTLSFNCVSEQHLEEIFEKWWNDLEKILSEMPKFEVAEPPKRGVEDILDEILLNTREQLRRENGRGRTVNLSEEQMSKLFEILGSTETESQTIPGKFLRNNFVHRAGPAVRSIDDFSRRSIQDDNEVLSSASDDNNSQYDSDLVNSPKEVKYED